MALRDRVDDWRFGSAARDLAAAAVASDAFARMGATLPERAVEVQDETPDMSATASSDLVVTMVLAEVASFCLTLAGVLERDGADLEAMSPDALVELSLGLLAAQS
jgi:hypothetical protein